MKKFVLLASVFGLLLSSCGTGPADQDPIKIGYIGPLTGDFSSAGKDTLNATQMRVDDINAGGGINGRMVELVAEDGRCAGAESASAAQKLINVDKVVAIAGGQCSSETLAAAPIANGAQIVLLSPNSTSPDVTEAGDFVFRIAPSDALKTKAMAQYIRDNGMTKVAIVTENTDYAIAFRDSLTQELGQDMVVFSEVVDPGTKDYRTLLTRLDGVDFDVFVPNGQTDSTVAAMMQQLRELGYDQPAIGQDVADSATLITLAGEAVDGMRLINTSSTLGSSGEDPFADRYRALHGEPQSNMSFTTLAYDAVSVLLDGIAAVGTDGPTLRDWLYDLPVYEGAAGTFSFDDNGDVIGIPYKLKEFKDGSIVEVDDIVVE